MNYISPGESAHRHRLGGCRASCCHREHRRWRWAGNTALGSNALLSRPSAETYKQQLKGRPLPTKDGAPQGDVRRASSPLMTAEDARRASASDPSRATASPLRRRASRQMSSVLQVGSRPSTSARPRTFWVAASREIRQSRSRRAGGADERSRPAEVDEALDASFLRSPCVTCTIAGGTRRMETSSYPGRSNRRPVTSCPDEQPGDDGRSEVFGALVHAAAPWRTEHRGSAPEVVRGGCVIRSARKICLTKRLPVSVQAVKRDRRHRRLDRGRPSIATGI